MFTVYVIVSVLTAAALAAAIGVILFFISALITHLRARWYSFTYPSTYLVLAVAAPVLGPIAT